MWLLRCPASFSTLMAFVIRGLSKTEAYIDNALMQMEQIFEHLITYHLKLYIKKSEFLADQLTYLEYEISNEGVRPGFDKAKLILVAKALTTVKDI